MPPLVSRLRLHEPRRPQPASCRSAAASGVAVAGDERRRVGVAGEPERARAAPGSARRLGVVRQVGDAQRHDRPRRSTPAASSASHSRAWRATSALRWNSSRRASRSPSSVSPGNAPAKPLAARERGVDLVAGVVVLEHDRHLAHLRQPAHGVARVGRHQEREVRRALRRRQAQAHRRRRRRTDTTHELTKPSVVIGSSSSGS